MQVSKRQDIARTAQPERPGFCPACGCPDGAGGKASLPEVLTSLMTKYKVTANLVERITGLDHAYVGRLASGTKTSPSRDVILQIVFALARKGLEFGEADEFVEAAGYASPYRRRYRDDPAEDNE